MFVKNCLQTCVDSLGEEEYIVKCVSYISARGDLSDQKKFVKELSRNLKSMDEEKIMTLAEQWKQEGRQEGLEKAAIGMLKEGIDLSRIASILDLPLSKLKKLKETTHWLSGDSASISFSLALRTDHKTYKFSSPDRR